MDILQQIYLKSLAIVTNVPDVSWEWNAAKKKKKTELQV